MSLTIILIFIVIITILYCLSRRNVTFWKSQNVPGPKPLPFIGNLLSIIFRSQLINEKEWQKLYGNIYVKYYMQSSILVIGDPELINDICIKDFNYFTDHNWIPFSNQLLYKNLFHSRGDDWKRFRSIMSPIFTISKMKNMFPIIKQCIDEYLEHLIPFAENKQDINIKEMNGNHTMNIIASCGFATKINAHKEPNNPFVESGRKAYKFNMSSLLAAIFLPKPIFELTGVELIGEKKSNQFFMDVTRQLLKQRKSNKQNKQFNDFIQYLADAHDKHKKLTQEEIMAQGWILFIAGFETTATSLSFSMYELAINSKVQEQLFKEIQTVNSSGELDYEALMTLPYLDAFVSETLRLYPPVLTLFRTCVSDYKLGERGIQIKREQVIEIPVFVIHTSEQFYDMPMKFQPDRFLHENRDKIKPNTYFPFGVGPRSCVARQFGLLSLKLSLAQIVTKYRLFRTEQTAVPLKYINNAVPTLNVEEILVGIQLR